MFWKSVDNDLVHLTLSCGKGAYYIHLNIWGKKLITHHEMYVLGVSIVRGGMNVFPWIYKYTGASVYVQMKATEND